MSLYSFNPHLKRAAAAALGISFLPSLAFSAPDLSDLMMSAPSPADPTSPIVLDNVTSGSVGYGGIDYLYINTSRPNLFNQAEGHFETQGTADTLQWKVNAEGMAILGSDTTYTFEAPEIYLGTSPALSEVVQVKVGRELHHWSHLDEVFELGIWQPRLRWDYVRPEEVGLAGVFIDIEKPEYQIVVMGSPGFVPDRGVPEEFQNGGIYSVSPYSASPATQLSFEGVNTNVNYGLDAPSTWSVLMHPAFSAMVRAGGSEGYWGSAAYAYMPMNQLLFSYSGVFNTSTTPEEVDATIYPRIAYHQLVSVEGGYETPQWGAWISQLNDYPNDDQPILGNTYETTSTAHAVSVAGEYRAGDFRNDPIRLQLALLKEWGGDPADQGTYATGSGSLFEERYPYQTAAIFQVASSLGFWGAPELHVRYKVLADFSHSGSIQSTDIDYLFYKKVLFNVGLDALSSGEPETATDPISEYRANSRIRAGMTYVF